MGYLDDYNKKNKKTDSTTSNTGGGYLSQYEAQQSSQPAPIKTATPTKKPEPITVHHTDGGFDVGGFLSNLGDTIKKAVTSAIPQLGNKTPDIGAAPTNVPDISTLDLKNVKKKDNVPLVLNDTISGQSAQLTPQTRSAISSTPNIIDTLLKPFTQAPQVVSPIPGQNTAPVNKSKLDLLKEAVNTSVPNTVSAVKEVFSDPLSLKANPNKVVGDVWNAVKEPFIKGMQLEIKDKLNTPKTVSGQVGLQAEKISNAVNILFTPITALFTAANDVPILGSVSRIISIPFVAAGETGTGLSGEIIDSLPIPKDAKERLKPGIGEISALAMQIALGKALEGGEKDKVNKAIDAHDIATKETYSGWKAGQKAVFDQALLEGDAPTIKKMLPSIPDYYKSTFGDKIQEITGIKAPPKVTVLEANKAGNFTPLIPGDNIPVDYGSIIAKAQGRVTAAKPFNLLDLIPALVDRYGKTDTRTIIDTAQKLADERKQVLERDTTANKNVLTPEEVRTQATGTNLKDTPIGEELLKTAAEAEKQGKNIQIDATDVKEGALTTPDGTSFKTSLVDTQTAGQKLLGAPKTLPLLEEPKPSNIGATFTMSDKVDKSKIEISKKIADYRESVQAYNKNPTVRTLQRFQRMRTVMDNLKKQDAVIEKPVRPAAVPQTEATPKIARITEAKNYTTASDFAEAVYAARPTDQIGLLDSRLIEARDAIDKNGKTYKDTVVKLKAGRSVEPIEVEYVDGKIKTVDGSNRLGAAQDTGKSIPVIFRGTDKVAGLKTFDEVFGSAKGTESAGKTDVKPQEVSVPRANLPVGKGEAKVSRLEARMKGVMKNATPDQIEELGLSKSNTAHNDQQLSEASKYVSENPQEALDVLNGSKEAPKGLLKNAIYVAMVEEAKLDVTLATKLVGLSAKRFGQELQILSELDPNNPVKIMNDVYNFREESFKRKNPTRDVAQAKKDVVESIKKNVKKPDKYDWENFINSIETC